MQYKKTPVLLNKKNIFNVMIANISHDCNALTHFPASFTLVRQAVYWELQANFEDLGFV